MQFLLLPADPLGPELPVRRHESSVAWTWVSEERKLLQSVIMPTNQVPACSIERYAHAHSAQQRARQHSLGETDTLQAC